MRNFAVKWNLMSGDMREDGAEFHLHQMVEMDGGLPVTVAQKRPRSPSGELTRPCWNTSLRLGRNEVWEFLKTLLVGHYGSEHVWID